MHELAIANSIMNSVLTEAERQNLRSIRAVGLRIGELTDVVPEALEFGFAAITSGTTLEGTRLEIERVPVAGLCNECHCKFDVRGFIFVCPECGSYDTAAEQGQELDIVYIEVDDSQEEG